MTQEQVTKVIGVITSWELNRNHPYKAHNVYLNNLLKGTLPFSKEKIN
jgi:hypothetical protein